jgi:hypothetical protein
MAQASGSRAQIIYDQETTFGVTPASPDARILPFLSEAFGQKRERNNSNVIRGNRNATKGTKGKKDVSGSIDTELNPYMGTLWKHVLGSVATTGSGPYTHTITVGALPVGLTIEKGFTDIGQYFLYNGCRVSKASLEFNDSGFVPFKMEFMGRKRTIAAASFDATPVDLGHLPWDMFEASIEEGGSAIANVRKVTMEIEENLDGENYCIGSQGERISIPEGSFLVSGNITALFEDLTLYNKAMNDTESSIRIVLSRGTGAGTAGNERMEFKVCELVYGENDPVVENDKGILVELPYAAFFDNAAEGSSFQVILMNTQATL